MITHGFDRHYDCNDCNERTEEIMKTIDVLYYDTRALLNRTKTKRWLSDVEQIVTKINPDFIVMKGCSRYLLFELNRKEWCKYYFISIPYNPTPVPNTQTRVHIILSRYPISSNDNFGDPLIHIVGTTISFNDLPMRYEYEDENVQSIDAERITLVVTDDHQLTEQHSTDVQAILQKITETPHTIILFGLAEDSVIKPPEWKQIKSQTSQETQETQESQTSQEKSQSIDVSYISQGWAFESINKRNGHIQFKLLEFD